MSREKSRKRSIIKGHAPSYRDSEQIEGYYSAAGRVIKRKVKGVTAVQPCPYPEDSQRTFLALWISACRKGEVILLRPEQWSWNEQAISGFDIPVLKKREKVKDSNGNIIYKPVEIQVRQQDGSNQSHTIYRPVTRPVETFRNPVVPRDIPLAEKFIDLIQELEREDYSYILYTKTRFKREPVKDRHMSERSVNDRIDELHSDLFPQAIRALHVRYLRDKFGKDFDTPELKEHLNWSSTGMAEYYLSGQKLANAMGITNIPQRRK